MNHFVRIRHERLVRASFEDGEAAFGVRFERAQEITLRDDPDEQAVFPGDRQTLRQIERRFPAGPTLGEFADRHLLRNGSDIFHHHFGDAYHFHCAGFEFFGNAKAAPRKLLRHDRAWQVVDRDHVCNHAAEHQRKNRVVVARDFESENDERKCGARCRAENRGHGHQRIRAGR